jgi:putative transposase
MQTKRTLHHKVPPWIGDGEVFHVRIRAAQDNTVSLTQPDVANALLQSVSHYESLQKWHCRVFLLMPDHLHALLAFPIEPGMSLTIRSWKAYHAKTCGVKWQTNYFDHRIRSSDELERKALYIRQNPVVKGLCGSAGEWRWVIGDLHPSS